MKRNWFVRSISIIAIIIFIISLMTADFVSAGTIPGSGYWTLTTDGDTSSSGGRKLKIETYLDGNKISDSSANPVLKFSNSYWFWWWQIDGIDPGNVTVTVDNKYNINKLLLNGSSFSNGSYISLNDDETKTLKIYLDTKKYDKSYNIEYYVDSTKQNNLTETVQVNDYIPGTTVNVPYKTPEQLGLPTAQNMKYVLDDSSQKTIIINVDSSTNTAKIYYNKLYEINYTVNYYVNSALFYTDTKTVTDYREGNAVTVQYKTLSELGLSPNCTLISGSQSTIVLNVTNPGVNVIDRKYTRPVSSYTINYYVNSVFQESETLEAENYDSDGNVTVDYKSAAELNLTSDYKVKGDAVKTIRLDFNDSGNNGIDIFYSNGTIAAEDPWKRSVENSKKSGGKAVEVISLNTFNGWTWNEAGNIKTSVEDESLIWDGELDGTRYYSGYSDSDRGFPYATWVRQSSGDKRDMRRFQTVITVPNGYDGNDFVRMKSVNQDAYMDINNGNIVPINDNIFVFVYPEGTSINNNNYLNYLAFWAGTESQSGRKAYFKDILGDPAYQDTGLAELRQTDGWHVYATVDNVGEKLVGAKAGDRYVVDIFTQDYAEGGGMDKYVFEFVKNKAPKTEDDAFITSKGETLNLSGNNAAGLLDNDFIYVPEAGAKAELVVDGSKLQRVSEGIYKLYDDSGRAGGTISSFDSEEGTFTFTPENGYIGVLKFEYDCYQKKSGQDVVDPKLKDTGEASIYVLPEIAAKHKQAEISNGKITNIASGTLKDDDVVYGWPADIVWNSNWVWPENTPGINRPAGMKSSYEVSSYTFPNHNYIGYNESGTDVADTLNSSKTLSGTFSSENKDVTFYYERGRSNLIVECYVKGTDKLLQRQSTALYSGSPYTVTIPSLTGYTYDSSDRSLSGTIPNGGLTVKLYYTANTYNYTVRYYFNDEMKHELTYSKSYGSVVNSYLKAEDIESLADMVNNQGYEFVRDENVPLTIGTDESRNVIKVYYSISKSKLEEFKMYPNKGLEPTVPYSNVEGEYGVYKIINGFDYTFGIKFKAGSKEPNINIRFSGGAGDYVTKYTLYSLEDGTVKSLVGMSDLTGLKTGNTYVATFGLNYTGELDEFTAELVGEIVNSGGVEEKLKLVIEDMPRLE